jgi:predicted esterase
VRRVEEEDVPAEIVRRRREDLEPKDVAGRLGLARYATAQSCSREATRLLEEALDLDSMNKEAIAAYGGEPKWRKFHDEHLERTLTGRAVLYELINAPGMTPSTLAERIEGARKARALPPTEAFLRVSRSMKEAKGLRRDEKLASRDGKTPAALYTVLVPESYDPWVPLPLVIALHDGGRGGRDGTQVVGSGRDAVPLYAEVAAARGWIVACPTAVVAPWSDPANEALVLALLDEVGTRWNVDLDRVFLVGHGMGAAGALSIGGAHLDLFAGLGASSGSSLPVPKGAKAAGTAVFLYHAADDPAAPVEGTRSVADALLAANADVVYLELPNLGHSFPTEGQREMYDVFRGKRLAESRRASDWPRPSFGKPPSPDEIRDLGGPAKPGGR